MREDIIVLNKEYNLLLLTTDLSLNLINRWFTFDLRFSNLWYYIAFGKIVS